MKKMKKVTIDYFDTKKSSHPSWVRLQHMSSFNTKYDDYQVSEVTDHNVSTYFVLQATHKNIT